MRGTSRCEAEEGMKPRVRHRSAAGVITALIAAVALVLCAPAAGIPIATASAPGEGLVAGMLASAEHPALRWSAIPDVAESLAALYATETDGLLWFENGAPLPVLGPAVGSVAAAANHGLDPDDYDADLLAGWWAAQQAGTLAEPDRALFDLGVSVAVARMLRAVSVGRVDPAVLHWGYDVAARPFDLTAAFREVQGGRGLEEVLDALEPQFSHYSRARRELAVYRRLSEAGDEPVPDFPQGLKALKPGAVWEGLPALAARLRVLGDLPPDPGAGSTTYDTAVVEAVKRFQWRHGLGADGIVGPATLSALNVPLERRVRQIELAMERMRWLPALDDRPNVFVNVAFFRLWATDPGSGKEPLRLNVVVGQSINHQTPIFLEEMEYVIFHPYWNPPRRIILREILPHARKDPSYLADHDFEIVASGADDAPSLPATPENLDAVAAGRLYVRQRPGPENSLGLAKFMFPNAENVYMHGTPAQELFSRTRRDFSHGCIRLEDPTRFAEWVLRDQPEWTRAKIEAAMQGSRPLRVNLKQDLKVVLFYDTVHVNSEGVVFFVDDIYGLDEALDGALRLGYPYPRK